MGIDDRRGSVGDGEARDQPGGDGGGYRQDRDVIRSDCRPAVVEDEFAGPIAGPGYRPQPGAEPDLRAVRLEVPKRRVDKGLRQADARQQRAARGGAAAERLAEESPEEASRS